MQRRRLIGGQMTALRTKPFVVGAIFWTYQDYRTPTDYKLGVVDVHRRRRGSWAVWREEYSPLLIESVTISPVSGEKQDVTITLRARGPIDRDMPSYTLREYKLEFLIASAKTQEIFLQRRVPLPTLAPGTRWSTRVEWPMPTADEVFTLRLTRPTGFAVLERSYDAEGNLRQTSGG